MLVWPGTICTTYGKVWMNVNVQGIWCNWWWMITVVYNSLIYCIKSQYSGSLVSHVEYAVLYIKQLNELQFYSGRFWVKQTSLCRCLWRRLLWLISAPTVYLFPWQLRIFQAVTSVSAGPDTHGPIEKNQKLQKSTLRVIELWYTV